MDEVEYAMNERFNEGGTFALINRVLDVTTFVYKLVDPSKFKLGLTWSLYIKNKEQTIDIVKLVGDETIILNINITPKELSLVFQQSYFRFEQLFVKKAINDIWRQKIFIDVNFSVKVAHVLQLVQKLMGE